MATKITATVKQETPRDILILVHDEDANEVGSLTIGVVPKGLRVECWSGEDTLEGQTIIRA